MLCVPRLSPLKVNIEAKKKIKQGTYVSVLYSLASVA